jgi:hypothetical protein
MAMTAHHSPHRFRRLRLGLTGAAATAALVLASAPGTAADAAKEIQTAVTHAGYAADATVLKTVHAHLQHTVNCLVGPKGAGFDAKQLDPCKGQGSGAIPDTADAAKKQSLEAALASAKTGRKANTLKAAKDEAQKTVALVKKAQ